MIQVLIVDDKKLFRTGLRAIFGDADGINTAGEASNGIEALERLHEHSEIQVVILDLNMPRMNGFDLTKKIRQDFPDVKILVFSWFDKEQYIKALVKMGVHGFISKNSTSRNIVSAVRELANGNLFFRGKVKEILDRIELNPRPKLTKREKEILLLIADDIPVKDIAEKLSIKIGTVEAHRKHIKRKLNINTTSGLVKYAFESGLIEFESKHKENSQSNATPLLTGNSTSDMEGRPSSRIMDYLEQMRLLVTLGRLQEAIDKINSLFELKNIQLSSELKKELSLISFQYYNIRKDQNMFDLETRNKFDRNLVNELLEIIEKRRSSEIA